MVSGAQPTGEEATLMQAHRDLDAESATMVAESTEPTRRVSERLPRGSTIGRYVVLDELGAGGMGVVYAAYDPELDRKIAIKVLQPEPVGGAGLSAGKARLVREAQALARLAHPNVVNVHDVGEVGGRVFVAMEYIEGSTLKRWLLREPRSRSEIIDVFIRAGQGLAAAHAAGLVHRDFKPDNVLVGTDGRPRVVDFGLARGQVGPVDSDAEVDSNSTGGGPDVGSGTGGASALDHELTAVGTVMGTPAYMAPEQHVGGKADAATDQFAFCVVLYRALYDERPFAGTGVRELARSVCRGKIRPAPPGSRVPGWLRRILVQGLQPLPEDRHASMAALLEALARDPAVRRRRRIALGLGVVLVAGVGAGAYVTGLSKVDRPCTTAGDAMDEVWSQARRGAIEDAFSATALPYAADTYARVDEAISEFASRWREGAIAACTATHVAQTQSAALLDRRSACLDTRRERLDALLEVYAHADASVVERAVSAAHGLPGVESCADLERLTQDVEPPATAELAEQVDALVIDLERAAALDSTGRYREALAEREVLEARAREIGYLPTLARAMHELAMTQSELGIEASLPLTQRAFAVALEAGDSRVGSRVAMDLAHRLGVTLRRPDDGEHWLEIAAALSRRGGGDLHIEAARLNVRAVIAARGGRPKEAQAIFEEMLERVRTTGTDAGNLAVSLMNLGALHAELREFVAARTYLTEAADVIATRQGPKHPNMIQVTSTLGMVSVMAGDYAQGKAKLHEALALQRSLRGERNTEVARSLAGIAIAERHLGDLARSEQLHREALALRQELLGPEHPEVAETLRNLSVVRGDLGFHDEGLALAREASEMDARLLPPEHATLPAGRYAVARHLANLGRFEDAMPILEALVDELAEDSSVGSRLVLVLLTSAEVQRNLGNAAQALALAERALELAELGPDPDRKAWACIEVATNLRALQRDDPRALRLAERAQLLATDDAVSLRGMQSRLEAFRSGELLAAHTASPA